jgi:hypothetical protein
LKLSLEMKRGFWTKSTRTRRYFSSNLNDSDLNKILDIDQRRAGGNPCGAFAMVTASVRHCPRALPRAAAATEISPCPAKEPWRDPE